MGPHAADSMRTAPNFPSYPKSPQLFPHTPLAQSLLIIYRSAPIFPLALHQGYLSYIEAELESPSCRQRHRGDAPRGQVSRRSATVPVESHSSAQGCILQGRVSTVLARQLQLPEQPSAGAYDLSPAFVRSDSCLGHSIFMLV